MDVVRDHEVLVAAVNRRALGVRVDRLESDPKASDLLDVQVQLGRAFDRADAPHVGLGEEPAVVPTSSRSGCSSKTMGCARVLRVLQQFEDEVRSICVELRQDPAVLADGLAVQTLVVSPDRFVVRRHGRPRGRRRRCARHDVGVAPPVELGTPARVFTFPSLALGSLHPGDPLVAARREDAVELCDQRAVVQVERRDPLIHERRVRRLQLGDRRPAAAATPERAPRSPRQARGRARPGTASAARTSSNTRCDGRSTSAPSARRTATPTRRVRRRLASSSHRSNAKRYLPSGTVVSVTATCVTSGSVCTPQNAVATRASAWTGVTNRTSRRSTAVA